MVSTGRNKKPEEYYDHDNNTWLLREIADEIERRDDFKYISSDDTDQLFVFDEGIWIERGESRVRQHAMEITNELIRKRNLNQLMRILNTRNEVYIEEFEYPKDKIPFQNGVYDLEEDEFRDFKKEDNFRFKFEVNYVENPENEKVDEFLHSLQDTEEKVRKLKEGAGLSMLPDHPIDKALVLYGQGSNGKNMYVKIIQEMLGDAAHKIDSKQLTGDKFAAAELEDKTFVFFDEFGSISDPDKLKTLIGDDTMRVRPFNAEGYITDQRVFPIFAANEMPKPPEQNPGFFRRWEIVDFPFRFTSRKDDEHKNKVPQKQLEQEYMSQEALDAFASRCVAHLKNVLEKENFTAGQSTAETRQRWNNKSSPVYSFINNFVSQGDLPKAATTDTADYISKKKLLAMVNNYAEMLNSTQVRSHELKSAMQNSPELELGNEGRIQRDDGSEERAYSGIVLTLPDFHDSHVSSKVSKFAKQHLDMFENCKNLQHLQMLEIVETKLELQACRYLETCDDDRTSMVELIKALDLSENQIGKVLDCEFIHIGSENGLDSRFPKIVFDREAFNNAVKESDELTGSLRKLKRPEEWFEDQKSSWSADTEKDIEDLLDKAEEEGFSREKIEEVIDKLESEGVVMKPTPDKVMKI